MDRHVVEAPTKRSLKITVSCSKQAVRTTEISLLPLVVKAMEMRWKDGCKKQEGEEEGVDVRFTRLLACHYLMIPVISPHDPTQTLDSMFVISHDKIENHVFSIQPCV